MRFNKKIIALGLLAASFSLTGCLTDDDGDKKGGNTDSTYAWTEGTTVTVGAQADTAHGSAVDLDVPRVLKSAAANNAQDSLDVVFAYGKVGADSTFLLASPRSAKDSGIALAANYDTSKVKRTEFVKVATAPANYTAGVAAFEAGTKTSYAKIAANDLFVVKTTLNNYVLVSVTSITGTGKAGQGSLNLKLKGLLVP